MDWDRLKKAVRSYPEVLQVGTLLRLALFGVPALTNVLQRRPELSTPLTSFRSLKEGVYIYERGTNPYSGGVFYHSPLYLAFFTYIFPISSNVLSAFVFTLIDVASAWALVRIWKTRNPTSDGSREGLVSALYLFNPYTLLSCLARSTTSVDNAVLLLAIASAASDQATIALFFLAIAVHSSLYPLLVLPPIIMLLRRPSNGSSSPSKVPTSTLSLLFTFTTFFVAFTGLNWTLAGFSWLRPTWGVITNVTDLTPNVGMWWYFFTEMFEHFRTFFLGVFQIHNLIYVAPICMRLSDDPLFAILVLVGIFSTWKSYPALGDMALWAGLLGCFPEVVSNLRHPLFTLTVHLYTSILLPLLHSLWLLTGTGNANFFYAATMVYGLNASLAIVDVLSAGLRLGVKRSVGDWLRERKRTPDIKGDVNGETESPDKVWEEKGWSVIQFTRQVS
ncbi:hypothetical protein CI109_101606 [Kwoniella shandongensis]|uniref:Uncharacterized protein n=1 Tax=Kwoniella shandongensis TaxID=1734106 RepID=A0A5M6C5Q0_9TREE|nr:uncharacterized protein CI109_001269 [Kwoniella shandongensis]KAA5530466.1 hypothetical protein CI109_001269 [Kwoniella shandongensis]